MAEVETVQAPVSEPEAPIPAPMSGPDKPTPPPRKKAADKKKLAKRLVALAAAVAVLGGGGFALYKFLHTSEDMGEIFSQPAMLGTIQSKVSGMGNATAKESAAITLTQSGTVQKVMVNVGDVVTQGQPLYTVYSEKAEEVAAQARENVNKKLKDISRKEKDRAELTVRAPFAGKLQEVKEFRKGQDVAAGEAVATLVNDQKLKMSLYFSYAYEKDIKVGQSVDVSIPAVMGSFKGSVEKINKVNFISPEGGTHFEAVITFKNPGTLTAGMDASAVLTAADGSSIYPYANAQTEFYETMPIVTKAGGPVVKVGNLLNHANVSAGETLLTLGSDTVDEELEQMHEELANLQSTLEEAEKALSNFNATAPINGTVISCSLTEGADVKENETVLIISNNTTMQAVIQVNDQNIPFIKPGDMVELDWNGTKFMGTVTKIDMGGAEKGQGMTNYPVTLEVDNADGSLMDGAWLQYSFVTKESTDCITIPASSVQYFPDKEGNRQSVVFVKRESRPEDVPELELPTFEPDQKRTFPTEEEGFYPVIVETGLSDIENIEIISGVEEGDEVFVAYTVTDNDSNW